METSHLNFNLIRTLKVDGIGLFGDSIEKLNWMFDYLGTLSIF